jgi:predicted AAA+ superfamily ATPase
MSLSYIPRRIDTVLLAWKSSSSRRVLLLRGARQVGKTAAIRHLAESFEHFVEINFEELPSAAIIFDGDLEVREICDQLSAFIGKPIIPGKTLLFFDEIQACPKCISSLRFFYERMPELHVVAAGSLLEFALENITSFGVGRITSVFVYPLTFAEFIAANSGNALAEMIERCNPANPMNAALHQKLIEKLRIYLAIGGLPAVVSAYLSDKGLLACRDILEDLVTIYHDDFARYRKRAPVARLRETFESIARQTGGKFVYSSVAPGCSTYESKQSLDLLERAGLAYRVYHTAAQGIPLGAQINSRKFKAILFDVGIHQRLLGLDLHDHIIKSHEDMINKGSVAELFAGLELVANGSSTTRPQLFYWHREAKSSSAEVDYIIQRGDRVAPIEVKAGTKGRMRSIRIFMEERGLNIGARVSEENFGKYESIVVLPIYAVGNLVSDRTTEWYTKLGT